MSHNEYFFKICFILFDTISGIKKQRLLLALLSFLKMASKQLRV